jgi:hypothetical protein
MTKIFMRNNVVLFILVVTTTIDASRIFYLPLPKIHSSQQQIQTPKIEQETIKKPISDEFIPASVIEQEEIESNLLFFFCFLKIMKSREREKHDRFVSVCYIACRNSPKKKEEKIVFSNRTIA